MDDQNQNLGSRQVREQPKAGRAHPFDKDKAPDLPARNNQDTQNRDLNEQERENEEENSGER